MTIILPNRNYQKNAAPVKVGASSTPDIVASRELAVRMRRLELDRLQFETEKARKELEFEERELEITRQFALQDACIPNQAEKAVAWLADTDRVGMATGAQRDGGGIGYPRPSQGTWGNAPKVTIIRYELLGGH